MSTDPDCPWTEVVLADVAYRVDPDQTRMSGHRS